MTATWCAPARPSRRSPDELSAPDDPKPSVRACVEGFGVQGTVEDIFTHPQVGYTQRLLDAIPGASIPLGRGGL